MALTPVVQQRIHEFEKILEAHLQKDEHGIFIIRASIPRLFLDVLKQDYGKYNTDAITVWHKYLSDLSELK